jgi:hypothetical protein
MDRDISSVIRSDVSLRGEADLFHIPYSPLKDRVNFTETQNALRRDIPVTTKPASHPTVLSVEEEQGLTARLKNLAGRGLGCTSDQTLGAVLMFANECAASF